MSSSKQSPSSPVRVACLVTTYNRDDFISECVASLLRNEGEGLAIEVTVINNGATDNTAHVLAKIDDPRVTIHTNEKNTRLALVWNSALEMARASGADYTLLLNDDIEMEAGAIAEMVAVCQENPMSLVTPVQVNHRRRDELDGGMRELLKATPGLLDDMILKGEPKRYYRQRTIIAAALLGATETFEMIGDFDPIFAFYGLDDDYANRARDMGLPLLVAMRARMLHLHGKTEASPNVSKKDWLRRWSTHYQARAVFEIKSPDRAFPISFARVVLRVAFDVVLFLFKRFPGGSMSAIRTLGFLFGHYGHLAARRKVEEDRLASFKASSGL